MRLVWLAVGYALVIVGGGAIGEWYWGGAGAGRDTGDLFAAVIMASVGFALITPRRRKA
ncbi:hypothetical protein ACQCSX_04370 [Pseudarthrobacter sp. P1]|uniref:hypothetical protein n=1 Tax=Pseudarthrobacter sp. P1 TaxID=3418418 RepID=UPI003CED8417